jgi:hypothetical protein
MWGLGSTAVLVLIPIVFVGIILVSFIGSLDETTRGDRIAKFFAIASNAAIFFTVLALLYQVIDSEEDAKQQAQSQLLETFNQVNQLQIDHPEIFEVIYPDETYNRIGDDEKIALHYTYAALSFFDRVYVLYRDGVIDERAWRGWENWISYAFTTSDYFLRAWDDNCGVYHPAFVAYIEETYGDGRCVTEGGGAAPAAATPSTARSEQPRMALGVEPAAGAGPSRRESVPALTLSGR